MSTIADTVRLQRSFFAQGYTRNPAFRLKALKKLRRAILAMQPEILSALYKDLGKSSSESYMTEIGMVLSEIRYMERHLQQFSAPSLRPSPAAQFPSVSYVLREPYGTVLIMSPWNYPFMLALEPAVDAIAAGNTVVIKPASYAPAVSHIIQKLISSCLSPCLAAVVEGGRGANQDLLDQHFDYIFFTGSQTVGRLVMEKAAAHLTPVTLELGGKSPCIVDATANLKVAADRIVFGKFLNLGQTCVAPDYLLVEESVKEPLIRELRRAIVRQFGRNPLNNPHYGRIINAKHYHRLLHLLEAESSYIGGEHDDASGRIAPALLDHATLESPCMQEEIFGPLLPILTFRHYADALRIIEQHPTPLALYLFSDPYNYEARRLFLTHVRFGGGCINDTIVHLATNHMGFGGTGTSGMGSYHGKAGFYTFTHEKSILDKALYPDLPIRYQPYNKLKDSFIKFFMK